MCYVYLLDLVRKNMEIDIIPKLRSLIRRKEQFFCLSYNFETREIVVHKSHEDYFAEIVEHRDYGHVKRAEMYCPNALQIGGKDYMVYMISIGDFRKDKIIVGENPIAKGLGVCLFDYVYFFIEEK